MNVEDNLRKVVLFLGKKTVYITKALLIRDFASLPLPISYVAPTTRWHRAQAPRNVVFIMASCYEWCIIKIVFARKGVNMNHDGGKLLCKHHINVSVRCENVLQIYLKHKYGARSNMRGDAMRRYVAHIHTHEQRAGCKRVRILHLFSNHCKIN